MLKKATVNSEKVAATLTNYPSYVDLSRVGITTLAEARSARMYADADLIVEQAREIVSAVEGHTKIASLTTVSELVIDYDGIRADYAVTDTYGAQAVWPDYEAVWHDGDFTDDKTGNGHNCTAVGSPAISGDTTPPLGKATDFDGVDDYFWTRGASIRTLLKTHNMGITGWAKPPTDSSGNTWMTWNVQNNQSLNVTNLFEVLPNDHGGANSGGYRVYWRQGNRFAENAGNLSGSWYHCAFTTRSTTDHELYRNGSSVGTISFTVGSQTFGEVQIGAVASTSFNSRSNLVMGELRLRKIALTTAWVTTEYNNQSDVAAFWGDWEQVEEGEVLETEAGSYTLNGAAINLRSTYVLRAAAGAHALEGGTANLLPQRTLNVESATYQLNGNAATLALTRFINPYSRKDSPYTKRPSPFAAKQSPYRRFPPNPNV